MILTTVTVLSLFGLISIVVRKPNFVDNYARLQLSMTFVVLVFTIM
jgi:hypothetical protein